MAELLVQQGHSDDALRVYRELTRSTGPRCKARGAYRGPEAAAAQPEPRGGRIRARDTRWTVGRRIFSEPAFSPTRGEVRRHRLGLVPRAEASGSAGQEGASSGTLWCCSCRFHLQFRRRAPAEHRLLRRLLQRCNPGSSPGNKEGDPSRGRSRPVPVLVAEPQALNAHRRAERPQPQSAGAEGAGGVRPHQSGGDRSHGPGGGPSHSMPRSIGSRPITKAKWSRRCSGYAGEPTGR